MGCKLWFRVCRVVSRHSKSAQLFRDGLVYGGGGGRHTRRSSRNRLLGGKVARGAIAPVTVVGPPRVDRWSDIGQGDGPVQVQAVGPWLPT